jgi:dihydroorotate dehydrogenase (NAD+) catalytic subunit
VALAKCWELVRVLDCDVIGIGGIASAGDALEFLVAGCRAVQVGTAVYADPDIGGRIAEGIREYLVEQEALSVGDIIGSLRVEEEWMLGPKPDTPVTER